MQFWENEECGGCRNLERDLERAENRINKLTEDLLDMKLERQRLLDVGHDETRPGKKCTCGPRQGCTEPCDRNLKGFDKEVERQRDAIAGLMYAGNQLARAMQDSMQRRDDLTVAWYQAVENVIPDRLKPIVCTSSEDASHEM